MRKWKEYFYIIKSHRFDGSGEIQCRNVILEGYICAHNKKCIIEQIKSSREYTDKISLGDVLDITVQVLSLV